MNYVEILMRFIERYDKREFTHKDIIKLTGTNCPYSVLKSLKKYYEIDYFDDVRIVKEYDTDGNRQLVKKRFRKYKILKRKETNVKKPCVWGEG